MMFMAPFAIITISIAYDIYMMIIYMSYHHHYLLSIVNICQNHHRSIYFKSLNHPTSPDISQHTTDISLSTVHKSIRADLQHLPEVKL